MMRPGRNNGPDRRRTKTSQMGFRHFRGYQGNGAGFRCVQRSVNGVLTRSWWVMSRAVAAVFGEEAVCYG